MERVALIVEDVDAEKVERLLRVLRQYARVELVVIVVRGDPRRIGGVAGGYPVKVKTRPVIVA